MNDPTLGDDERDLFEALLDAYDDDDRIDDDDDEDLWMSYKHDWTQEANG